MQESQLSNGVKVTDSRLIAWYDFDNVISKTVLDMSGKSTNGTLNGNATISTDSSGKSGNSLVLDGTNGTGMDFSANDIAGLSKFTVSTWINVPTDMANAGTGNYSKIWSIGKPNTTTDIYLTPKAWDGKGLSTYFDKPVTGKSSLQNLVTSSKAYDTPNQWVHTVLTSDGTDTMLYYNGVKVAAASTTASSGNPAVYDKTTLNPAYIFDATNPNEIVSRIGYDALNTRFALKGMVDDFRVYNTSLSSAEIADLANGKEISSSIYKITTAAVNATTLNSVSLSWSATANATGYNIYRATGNGGYELITQTPITETTFIDTSVADETSYSYRITAIKDGNEFAVSDTLKTTTPAINPTIPNGITSLFSDGKTILLNWNSIDGIDGYNVYRATTINGDKIKLNSSLVINNTFIDDSFSVGTNLYYFIQSVRKADVSNYSEDCSVNGSTLTPITNLTSNGINTTSLMLSWDAVSGATDYNIYRSTSRNSIYTKVNTLPVTSTSFTDGNLTMWKDYDYRVTAKNSLGVEFAVSSTITAQTALWNKTKPEGVSVGYRNGLVAFIQWNTVIEAESYDVYRSVGINGEKIKVNATPIINNYFYDDAFTPGVDYYYYVASVNSNEESDKTAGKKLADSRLIAWYDFDNISNRTVLDMSGKGNNGTLNGTATISTDGSGKSGNSLVLDGTNGTGMEFSAKDIVGLNKFTVSTWINVPADMATVGVGKYSKIWSIGKPNTTADIYLTPKAWDGKGLSTYFDKPVTGKSSLQNLVTSSKAYDTPNQWVHTVLTSDGTDTMLYYNGVKVAAASTTASSGNPMVYDKTTLNPAYIFDATNPNEIVSRIGYDALNTRFPLKGMVDDFRVYNTSLSSTEISNIKNGIEPTYTLLKVSNAKISNATSTQISISWDAFSGATGYNIYRTDSNSNGYTKIATAANTSFVDNTIQDGTMYAYRVTAQSTGNEIAVSDTLKSVEIGNSINCEIGNISYTTLSVGTFYVSATITNTIDNAEDVTIYVAAVSKDSGIMTNVKKVDTVINGYGSCYINTTMNSILSNSNIKIFVWNKANLRPLSKSSNIFVIN